MTHLIRRSSKTPRSRRMPDEGSEMVAGGVDAEARRPETQKPKPDEERSIGMPSSPKVMPE
jgi:hypothetical protein